jgi:hypothetical protein
VNVAPDDKTKLSIDTSGIPAHDATNPLPTVNAPGWRAEYDPVVMAYRYVHDATGAVQYDHPDEVRSPADAGEHRSAFSTALKRTLSPRFLIGNAASQTSRPPSPTGSPESRGVKLKKRTSSMFGKGRSERKSADLGAGNGSQSQDEDDEEEFRRQLEQEMLDYENQRLHKNNS